MKTELKVALIGNPNVGKTSIFNLLTGLNQHVGNYPGITVEKKIGSCKLSQTLKARIYDLPGAYSTNPKSLDEKIAIHCLLDKNDIDYPDVLVVVADVENLKQNLYLFSQVKDLGIPTILAINMADRMQPCGITIDVPSLEEKLQTKVVLVSTRKRTGIEELKQAIGHYKKVSVEKTIDITRIDATYFKRLQAVFPEENLYKLWLVISQNFEVVDSIRHTKLQTDFVKTDTEIKKMQQRETILRYQFINDALKENYEINSQKATNFRGILDRILLHKIWGYVIFLLILFLIFQVIFYLSSYPIAWIEMAFGWLGEASSEFFPEGKLTSLFIDGVLPGVASVLVFIPQIALLFLFISLLEESGYMSRVVFLMDRIMRPFGLNGKSTIPLISGAACAIPAVMATRTIESWRERLITILVTPFVACSARLPIYLIVIKLIIPDETFWLFNYHGIVLFLLYVAGGLMAIFCAWILHKTLSYKEAFKHYFIIEMPNYKWPLLRNVAVNVYEKSMAFVTNSGKIIFLMTIIIWFLQTHGISENYKNAENFSEEMAVKHQWNDTEKQHFLESYKSEHSILGNIGKTIQPIFAPLGYDWRMSIAVLGSFAARETFVSTLSTIYSLGKDIDIEGDEEQNLIISRLKNEKYPDGSLVFSFATGISILIFFAFAMQCISTFAIVKKETNSWKWAFIQWGAMSAIAYVLAFIAYQIFN